MTIDQEKILELPQRIVAKTRELEARMAAGEDVSTTVELQLELDADETAALEVARLAAEVADPEDDAEVLRGIFMHGVFSIVQRVQMAMLAGLAAAGDGPCPVHGDHCPGSEELPLQKYVVN